LVASSRPESSALTRPKASRDAIETAEGGDVAGLDEDVLGLLAAWRALGDLYVSVADAIDEAEEQLG